MMECVEDDDGQDQKIWSVLRERIWLSGRDDDVLMVEAPQSWKKNRI